MVHFETFPASMGYPPLPELTADFCVACELVKDLPDQNGDDEWTNFNTLWQQLQRRSESYDEIRTAIYQHVSLELMESPLFEILFECDPHVDPPKTFNSALRSSSRIEPWFTAQAFINTCVEIDNDYAETMHFGDHYLTPKLMSMVRFLAEKQVNVLEFLSADLTDEGFESCSFLKVFVQTLSSHHSHVICHWPCFQKEIDRLNEFQGFNHRGSTMHVPPYPPNEKNGINFNHAHFLKWMQAAEADIDSFMMYNESGLESFDILHKRLHQMMSRQVTVAEMMDGREPAEGTPGAIIYKHLIDASDPQFDCYMFFANVVTNGQGQTFWDNARQPPPATLLTETEAIAFVDALKKVDVVDIRRDCMRCSHCWGNFDEVDEGINNLPVQLPCDSRHMLGRDCLIEVLTKTGPLCPLCRVDIVALGAQANAGSA